MTLTQVSIILMLMFLPSLTQSASTGDMTDVCYRLSIRVKKVPVAEKFPPSLFLSNCTEKSDARVTLHQTTTGKVIVNLWYDTSLCRQVCSDMQLTTYLMAKHPAKQTGDERDEHDAIILTTRHSDVDQNLLPLDQMDGVDATYVNFSVKVRRGSEQLVQSLPVTRGRKGGIVFTNPVIEVPTNSGLFRHNLLADEWRMRLQITQTGTSDRWAIINATTDKYQRIFQDPFANDTLTTEVDGKRNFLIYWVLGSIALLAVCVLVLMGVMYRTYKPKHRALVNQKQQLYSKK